MRSDLHGYDCGPLMEVWIGPPVPCSVRRDYKCGFLRLAILCLVYFSLFVIFFELLVVSNDEDVDFVNDFAFSLHCNDGI